MSWADFTDSIFPVINFVIIVFFLPFLASQRRNREHFETVLKELKSCFRKEMQHNADQLEIKLGRINDRIDAILRRSNTQNYWDKNKGC